MRRLSSAIEEIKFMLKREGPEGSFLRRRGYQRDPREPGEAGCVGEDEQRNETEPAAGRTQ